MRTWWGTIIRSVGQEMQEWGSWSMMVC